MHGCSRALDKKVQPPERDTGKHPFSSMSNCLSHQSPCFAERDSKYCVNAWSENRFIINNDLHLTHTTYTLNYSSKKWWKLQFCHFMKGCVCHSKEALLRYVRIVTLFLLKPLVVLLTIKVTDRRQVSWTKKYTLINYYMLKNNFFTTFQRILQFFHQINSNMFN